jgi:peptidoglycan/LPS O-acetylase OafA/YrhL
MLEGSADGLPRHRASIGDRVFRMVRRRLTQLFSSGLRGTSSHLFGIECLRGLAVLLVFLFHANGVSQLIPRENPGLLEAFVLVGNTGVTLFFVLSGFLLSLPWLKTLARTPQEVPNLRAYAAARALRILPLYYTAILVAALDLHDADLILPAAAFQMLGFEYFPHSVVWWTLITEVQFYLLLPALGWMLLAPRRRYALLVLLGLWLGAYLHWIAFRPDGVAGFFLTKSVFARLPAFLFGIGAAWIFLTRPRPGSWLRCLLFCGGLIGLALLLREVAAMGEATAESIWHTYHVPESLAWTAVVLALADGPRLPWLAPIINTPLALTGKLSYSIYLNHVPILFYVVYPVVATEATTTRRLQAIGLAAIASVVVAAVTYLAVERPALKIKERLRL